METRLVRVNDINKCSDAIKQAAKLIRKGETVAFPTETVYGLGANALDPEAVEKIFKAKGRPADNPLIVHIDNINDLKQLTAFVRDEAYQLIERFWPGPLTIIFDKSSSVPDIVTAGLDTVAIRMPSHSVAAALIRESGVPIAAPSANSSGRPSPTSARHVYDDLKGRIPMILDGGRTDVGLESTVLDITGDKPVILRPGGITYEMLREVLGEVELDPGIFAPLDNGRKASSPGMKYRHYAPNAPVTIYRGDISRLAEEITKAASMHLLQGKKVGIIATDETSGIYNDMNDMLKNEDARDSLKIISLGSRKFPADMAAHLFECLREIDRAGVDVILAEGVDRHGEGLAIMNRLARAAGFHFVDVD